jgi:hypothetical protein
MNMYIYSHMLYWARWKTQQGGGSCELRTKKIPSFVPSVDRRSNPLAFSFSEQRVFQDELGCCACISGSLRVYKVRNDAPRKRCRYYAHHINLRPGGAGRKPVRPLLLLHAILGAMTWSRMGSSNSPTT